MTNATASIMRSATRKSGQKLNILTFPTHERYETGLAQTGHNFYAFRAEGIKDWNTDYGSCPDNYVLLDPNRGWQQLLMCVDFDLILSQNKFGQFQHAAQLAHHLHLPIVSLEHTLPMPQWPAQRLQECRQMRGDINVFISNYSIDKWGWETGHDTTVITHMVDTDVFSPGEQYMCHPPYNPRENHILSVVNDWINRDWCMLEGTQILSVDGYKSIESISTNDKVLTDSGQYNRVSKTFKRLYKGKMIEITLDNNHVISFTPDHNIRMFRKNANNQWKYMEAKNLKINDKLRFPTHKSVDFSCTDTKYAWLIGVIIGDGHISNHGIQISVHKDDPDLAEDLQNIMSDITHSNANISTRNKNNGVYIVECSSKIWSTWLKEKIYESKQKVIPDFIFNSTNKIRLYCLQGLFKADGSFKNGDRCDRFVYSTISYKLASQVSSILHSIGVKCSINTEHRDTNMKKNTTIYRVVGYGKTNCDLAYNLIHGTYDDNFIDNQPTGYEYEITNIESREYNGFVYNCEVENDHSYVVYPGFTAHNCCNFQGWQRITQGLPVRVVGDTRGLSEPAPSIEALVNEYRNSKVFLNTSTISPVPTALLEAMACGCAVVSTATCMIPEIIENGVNGFMSNDEGELREYCTQLLQDERLVRTLGYNAQETIEQNFNKDKFLTHWNDVFEKASTFGYGVPR